VVRKRDLSWSPFGGSTAQAMATRLINKFSLSKSEEEKEPEGAKCVKKEVTRSGGVADNFAKFEAGAGAAGEVQDGTGRKRFVMETVMFFSRLSLCIICCI
jgi:hypothetical protein